jgi:peptidoglycan/xylan/chitin deacetylase (PgdA/CDA1 family)
MKFVFAALIGLQLGLVQSHPTALNGVGPEPFVSTDNIPKLNYSKASPAFYTCLKPGMIALTYNEAPSHNFKDLLDILNSNDVQATFFISAHHLNDITKEPYNSLLQQAFKDGHLIGSNTYNHKDLEKLSLNEQWQELKRNDNAISNLIGVRPVYVRPPYGSGLKNQTLQAILGSWGYKMTWAVIIIFCFQKNDERKFLNRKLIECGHPRFPK